MMPMKKCLLFPALCFLLITSAHATPDASDWYKVDLIGSNGTNFFYYLTHEELPGSYDYSFTNYYLVSRNIKTGEITQKIHLKTTKNVIEDNTGEFIRKYEHLFISGINPMDIIKENDVEALYPCPDVERRFNFEFDEKGMQFVKGGKKKVLSKSYIDRFVPGYEEWLDWDEGVDIVQTYLGRDYYYFLLQYGVGGDMDYFQAILPVSADLIRQLSE